MPVCVGADGCKAGWLLARAVDDAPPTFTLAQSFSEVVEATSDVDLALVDIPIGLATGPARRKCDELARRILKRRHVTVFTPPVRLALEASTRGEADAINRAASSRGVGAHLFGIFPKLREVDAAFVTDHKLQRRIREIHPEVCFAALNSWQPVSLGKENPYGHRYRLSLLKPYEPHSTAIVSQTQSKYGEKIDLDDSVDALVALSPLGSRLPKVLKRSRPPLRSMPAGCGWKWLCRSRPRSSTIV